MSQRADIFLFDDEECGLREEKPSPVRAVPQAPEKLSAAGAIAAKSLDLLIGIQVLLAELLAATKGVSGDFIDPAAREAGNGPGDGHASATRTLTSTVSGNGLRCHTEFRAAQAFTVQCNVDTPGVSAQMTVEWRLDGSSITRTVDVAAGVSVSGFGQAVTVTVADNTTVGQYFTTATNYIVTVTITPGTRPGSGVPLIQTGKTASTVNAGATLAVNVPAGANGVIVHGVAGGVPASLYVDLEALNTAGGSVGTKLCRIALNGTQAASFPLVAGTSRVLITNEGNGQASVTVLFTIDG